MVDQLLGGLFSGQDNDDEPPRRGRAQDFVNRYEQGAPWDNISGEESLQNYQNVSQRLSPQEYEDAAMEAFQRLSPQQRSEFAQFLQQQGGAQFGGRNVEDPRQLAQFTRQYQQQQEGGLASLLGGGGVGDLLNNPLAKAALGGIAAMAMRRMMR